MGMEFVLIALIFVVFVWLYDTCLKDKKHYIDAEKKSSGECAGCGKKFLESDSGLIIKGQDGINRLTHKGECYKKVWNGFLYEKDNKKIAL